MKEALKGQGCSQHPWRIVKVIDNVWQTKLSTIINDNKYTKYSCCLRVRFMMNIGMRVEEHLFPI